MTELIRCLLIFSLSGESKACLDSLKLKFLDSTKSTKSSTSTTKSTFKWTSESSNIAAVHCVIIGFANFHASTKKIFDGDKVIIAQNINAYLLDAPNVFIENRGKPPHGFPKMTKGNQPTDGGNLILSPNERDELIAKNPLAEKYIHQFVGAAEFIKGKLRYCLWLKDCPPNELRTIRCPCPKIYATLIKK